MAKIKVKINDELYIELRQCKEVYGHDDSLPYNAKLFVNDVEVGKVYNDGWGGESVIEANVQQDPLLTKVENYLHKNHSFVYTSRDGKRKCFPLDLGYVLDAAAYECIDRKKKEIGLLEIEGVE
jgi:hypothetical protein